MLRSVSERYVEDQIRRYPNLDRAYFIKSERTELLALVALYIILYGAVLWLLWVISGPDFATGAGTAYLGYTVATVWERLGRIAAFKRLMGEDD